jgi:hypothetical protein
MLYSSLGRYCHKDVPSKGEKRMLFNNFHKQIIPWLVKYCNFHGDNIKSIQYLNMKYKLVGHVAHMRGTRNTIETTAVKSILNPLRREIVTL